MRSTVNSAESTSELLQERKAPAQLQELQLAGKLPAPIPVAALRYDAERQGFVRPQLAFKAGAKVSIWASNTNFYYVLGQDSTGLNTVTAVDVAKNNCFSPVALKVDHKQNLWVACELNSTSGNNGVLQEYNSAGVFQRQYTPACPAPVSQCSSFIGYGWDSAVDAHGNIFASLNLYSYEFCTPTCVSGLSAGVEWWPAGQPNAAPKLISVGANCSPICGVGFMDADASGNLWFTFGGYDKNNNFGFGLGEIRNPTTAPTVRIVEPFGTYGFFGGVSISNSGTILNVIDQKARTISQYHLPLAHGGAPFKVLGPTLLNAFGIGDPTSGGFNQNDTKIAIGDPGGWLDLGKVSLNQWTAVANPNFYSGIEGAAYTPSDK